MTEQYNKHEQWGTGLTFNWKGQLSGREATFTSGVTYAKDMDKPRQEFQIPWGRGRARNGPPTDDTTFSLENPAMLTEFTYQVLNPLNVRLGARYDWLNGKHRDNRTGVKNSVSYKFFSPKAGLIYSPIDSLDIYANYGRGFTMPGYFAWGASFFQSDNNYDLSKSDQYEIGFRYRPLDWLGFEATYYQLLTDKDGFNDPAGNYIQAGKTKREGIELSVQAVPTKDWSITANYAYMEAKYKEFMNGNINLAGYRLPFVPRQITNVEVAYGPETGFGGRLSFRWESGMLFRDTPLTLANGQPNTTALGNQITPFKASDRGSLDFQLSYTFNEKYKVLFDAKNIIGKSYEGYAYGKSWDTGDYITNYTNPRAFYLTFMMNWDAKE
jgi:iron complex outermembrane receptor protein